MRKIDPFRFIDEYWNDNFEMGGDPIEQLANCREAQEVQELAGNRFLLHCMTRTYAAFLELKDRPKEWGKFEADARAVLTRAPRRVAEDSDKLAIAVRYVFERSHGYDRAMKFARALDLYLIGEMTLDEAKTDLQEEGIEDLIELAADLLPRKGKSKAVVAAQREGVRNAIKSKGLGNVRAANQAGKDDTRPSSRVDHGTSKDAGVTGETAADDDEAVNDDENGFLAAGNEGADTPPPADMDGPPPMDWDYTLAVDVTREELARVRNLRPAETICIKLKAAKMPGYKWHTVKAIAVFTPRRNKR